LGTNYYLHSPVCEHCGRGDEPLHIGKSSAGWCFTLHVIPDKEINTLEDWQREWSKPGKFILNEYDEAVPFEEMIDIITNRSSKGPDAWTRRDYADNYAEPGPNGLVRHQLGRYCVGHGAGTWDLCPGEFS
jgi:hypothetical protein